MPISQAIADLREENPTTLWKHEEHDFTPWLLENLDRLSEAIGIELDKSERQREVRVGRYMVDIEAKETGSGRKVVIENQLTASDHSHLGQLLTYAAGREAATVIWLCWELREEHRKALDWLNAHTDEETAFFGVEVEVLRIGDSAPAVRFNPVVVPPEWENASTAPVEGRLGQYQAFFQTVMDELRDHHNFASARRALPQSWYSFSAGSSGLYYAITFTEDKNLRAEVSISSSDREFNKAVFDFLQGQREALEARMGAAMTWERGNMKLSRIYLLSPGSVEGTPDELKQLSGWAVSTLLKLKESFGTALAAAAREVRGRRLANPEAPPAS